MRPSFRVAEINEGVFFDRINRIRRIKF